MTNKDNQNKALDSIAQKTLDIIPLIMRVMSAEMRQSEYNILPSQISILGTLDYQSYTLGELAEMHMVSAPTMSNTITALEDRGWVNRVRSEHDRRVVKVELADEGRQVLEEIEAHTRERIIGFLKDLDDKQQNTLSSGLTILSNAFSEGLQLLFHHQPPTDTDR